MNSFKFHLISFSCILFFFSSCSAHAPSKKASVKSFGAYGDGKHDDTKAFIKAMKSSNDTIVFPKGVYAIKGPVKLSDPTRKTLIATNATIKNISQAGTIIFERGRYITINGGQWIHSRQPSKEGPGGSEHSLMFVGTRDINVSNVVINGSAQMGICMMGVINGTIQGNSIKNCYRDGIYSHYSANLVITRNKISNVKDDAISMHDYGIVRQKPELIKAGLKQAGQSKITFNEVDNAYQGFSSIGCNGLTVSNNTIKNTVNAGIAVFNSVKLFKGSTARVRNITISNNTLSFTGGSQYIMGKKFTNGGQLSSGRAAIFVSDLDEQDLINNHKSFLYNVSITNNSVADSYVNGAYVAQVDGLIFTGNSFTNCDIDRSQFSGRIVEITNCSSAQIINNKVIDSRSTPRHDAGYQIKNIKGKMSGWNVSGVIDKVPGYIYDSNIN